MHEILSPSQFLAKSSSPAPSSSHSLLCRLYCLQCCLVIGRKCKRVKGTPYTFVFNNLCQTLAHEWQPRTHVRIEAYVLLSCMSPHVCASRLQCEELWVCARLHSSVFCYLQVQVGGFGHLPIYRRNATEVVLSLWSGLHVHYYCQICACNAAMLVVTLHAIEHVPCIPISSSKNWIETKKSPTLVTPEEMVDEIIKCI